ncbi:MAG: hypothetical protein EAZ57_00135 [Cytophagales bacterium]|nr:MAG: hypothetical protein EAZ67_13055 [Cytophagales bacterium]TAF62510.1 MAG: hypothetical protein EAZ57_00135 [Cytophagales bacterium]
MCCFQTRKFFSVFWPIFLIGFFVSSFCKAQGKVRFDKIELEDGLSQNSVVCFLQDYRGLMWIGTQDGLNLYDGNKFKHFKSEADNKRSISDNFVSSLFEDSQKRLWVGTENGLNLFDRSQHSFTKFVYSPQNPYSITQNNINVVFEDSKKQIWVGTNEGLNRLVDVEKGKFSRYINQNPKENRINGIIETSEGRIWLATDDGLVLWDNKAMKFGQKLWAGTKIKTIKLDAKGNLLAVSGQKIIRKDLSNSNDDAVIQEFSYEIADVLAEKNGGLWVSTYKFGLFWYPSGDLNSEPKEFIQSLNNPDGIATNSLGKIYQDRSGVFWIGTEGFGICKFSLKASKFNTYSNSSQQTIFSSDVIRAICEDRFGRLWVGTSNGLDKINRRTNEGLGNNVFSGEQVNCIFEESSGVIWVGTKTKGLFKYTGNDISLAIYESQLQNFQHSSTKVGSIPSNNIKVIFQDRAKNIWIGTEDAGFARFVPKDGTFVSYTHDRSNPKGLSNNRIRGIYEDKSGIFWISTNGGGLNRFDPKNESFKVYKHISGDTNSISTDRVYPVYETEKGFFWVLTYGGGLNKFDPKTEKFTHITEEDGLPNNVLYGVLAKSDKELWFSTNRGITRFDTEKMVFKQYTIQDGLQSYEYNFGSLHKSRSGEMFFGGINGLNYFFPDSVKRDKYQPDLIFTDFQIANKSVLIDSLSFLQKHISETNKLILDHTHNSFAIEFASLDFANPQNNKYAYKLVGFENDWVFVNQGVAKYTNLDYGSYTLRVRGTNSDGSWSDKTISLRIEIEPPFYRRTWFIVLVVFTIVAFVFAFAWRRERRANQMQAYLTRTVNERTSELSAEKRKAESQKDIIEAANRKIKDSIRYAERIQQAILPHPSEMAKLFDDYFVLFKPRDIVSGDFYWCSKEDNAVSIALVDCTGHGVPGAFMSVFGFALLEQTVNVQHFISPAQILTEMNKTIVYWLKQDSQQTSGWKSRDGMDMVFLEIKPLEKTIVFSGARNSAFLIQNDEIKELKGDKFSIGGTLLHSEEKVFTETVVHYNHGDLLYLTSDGYFDQFGGQENRKLTKKNLKTLLWEHRQLSLDKQRNGLEQFFENWRGKYAQIDDVLLIGIKL